MMTRKVSLSLNCVLYKKLKPPEVARGVRKVVLSLAKETVVRAPVDEGNIPAGNVRGRLTIADCVTHQITTNNMCEHWRLRASRRIPGVSAQQRQ